MYFTIQHEWTPLHLASYNGNTDIVKTLLAHGGDIHAKDIVSKCYELFYDLRIRK